MLFLFVLPPLHSLPALTKTYETNYRSTKQVHILKLMCIACQRLQKLTKTNYRSNKQVHISKLVLACQRLTKTKYKSNK